MVIFRPVDTSKTPWTAKLDEMPVMFMLAENKKDLELKMARLGWHRDATFCWRNGWTGEELNQSNIWRNMTAAMISDEEMESISIFNLPKTVKEW